MFARIREDIRSVFDRDPAARNAFEVLTTYPGLHAIWFHRLTHRLWRHNFKFSARWLSTLARWLTGVEIHPGARIGRRSGGIDQGTDRAGVRKRAAIVGVSADCRGVVKRAAGLIAQCDAQSIRTRSRRPPRPRCT